MEGCVANLDAKLNVSFISSILEKAIEITGDPIIIINSNEKIIWANRAFQYMSGFESEKILGIDIHAVLHISGEAISYKSMFARGTVRSGCNTRKRLLSVRRADGSAYRAEEIITVMLDANGDATHFVLILHDLTEADDALDVERRRANQDPLTGLAGRALLTAALEEGLRVAAQTDTMLALIFLDLDGFKQINDCHGHLVGDALLRAVGARLLGVVRSTDTVGRFGGDEFVVVLPSLKRRDTAKEVARKFIDQLSQPFVLPSGLHRISASAGLAFYPDHGNDSSTLLARADQAMYFAKRNGGRQLAIAAPDTPPLHERNLPSAEVPISLSGASGSHQQAVYGSA
jgi:diguanylate cyclase (GGDEF)-like protein/PAS domain S-box-containing protein